jgi:hypothetical protein
MTTSAAPRATLSDTSADDRGVQPDHAGRRSPATAFTWLVSAASLALVLTLFGLALRVTLRPLADPDLWWHLRMGAELRKSWDFTQTQSWTPFATASWIRTQWLPEVAQSSLYARFGLPGVAWLYGATLLAIVGLLYLVCRRRASPAVAAIVTGISLVGMSGTLAPRPQLVSFALILVVTDAWLRTASDARPRWWLIPLTWVWACCHGMWFTGPLVGVAVTLGMLIDGRVTARRALRLFLIPLLSVAAGGLTPVGPQLLRTPFAVGRVSGFVTEWSAPSIHHLAPATTFLVFACLVLMWSRGQRIPMAHVGLLIVALGWALLSERTVTVGAAMMAPLLASGLQNLVTERREKVPRAEVFTIAGAALVCATLLAVWTPATSARPGSVPLGLDARLSELPTNSVVLNAYEVGGWLLWRHPTLAPVVDGRTEAYSAKYLARYLATTEVRPGWDDFVLTTGARWAILQSDSPHATALVQRAGWRSVATNDGYVLLRSGSS